MFWMHDTDHALNASFLMYRETFLEQAPWPNFNQTCRFNVPFLEDTIPS